MMNKALNNGLIAGGIGVLITLVLYLVDKSLMMNNWIGSIATLVMLYYMYDSTRSYFQTQEEHTFRGAFQFPFLTGAVATVISVIFAYVLFNFIDPDLNQMMVDKVMGQMENIRDIQGEEVYEKTMEMMKPEQMGMSIRNVLIGLMVSLIFPVGIFALIFAAILKNLDRKKQIFA